MNKENKSKDRILFEAFAKNQTDPFLAGAVSQQITDRIPNYHYKMMRDQNRNQFYYDILKDQVQGKTVLEIGTGAGLVSMLCVKLGAKHVYTCDSNHALHLISKQIFIDNKMDDRITSFALPSNKLLLGKHIPKKVDIIVSEIFGDDGICEGVISSLADAKRLLKKGGKILPEKFELTVQAFADNSTQSKIDFGGFDFSFLDDIWSRKMDSSNLEYIQTLGKVLKVLEIDFENDNLKKPISGTFLTKDLQTPTFCLGFNLKSQGYTLSTLGKSGDNLANHWDNRRFYFHENVLKDSAAIEISLVDGLSLSVLPLKTAPPAKIRRPITLTIAPGSPRPSLTEKKKTTDKGLNSREKR